MIHERMFIPKIWIRISYWLIINDSSMDEKNMIAPYKYPLQCGSSFDMNDMSKLRIIGLTNMITLQHNFSNAKCTKVIQYVLINGIRTPWYCFCFSDFLMLSLLLSPIFPDFLFELIVFVNRFTFCSVLFRSFNDHMSSFVSGFL